MTTEQTTKLERRAVPIPDWARAVIVAEFEEDRCDSMTDYYATAITRAVVIGFSRHGRDLFPELRKAAAKFPPTAELSRAPKSAEHREKYSMGAGYYLKNDGAYSTGWKIRKHGIWWLQSEDQIEVFEPTRELGEAPGREEVKAALNIERDGVELRFGSKPSEAIRSRLKGAGWRWSKFSGCWYTRDTQRAREFARMFDPSFNPNGHQEPTPQPSLPGAEEVRKVEHETPTFDAPFALAAEVSTEAHEAQAALFAPEQKPATPQLPPPLPAEHYPGHQAKPATAREIARELWEKFDANERAGVAFGMFPYQAMKQAEADHPDVDGHALVVALMQIQREGVANG